MKRCSWLIFIVVAGLNKGFGQMNEIAAMNDRMEGFYMRERADSLTACYAPGFTYLPEYKPSIYEREDLRKFFADWLGGTEILAYKKKIYSTEMIAGHVLEIGAFSLRYSIKAEVREYKGKYMIVWKRNAAGVLKILSEAFGSDVFIKAEEMPYARVEVKDKRPLEKNDVSKKLQPAIEVFDKGVVKAVMEGDGAARAAEFTEDGIYMPHFDPMQSGMAALKPYMLRTYSKPGMFAYVKDTYREVFDSDEFVLLAGHFKVGWDRTDSKGSFEGNMLNLMKRQKGGTLLMYRQLAHN